LLKSTLSAISNASRVFIVRAVVVFVVGWAVLGLAYGYLVARTVIIETTTSTFRIALKEDLDPLSLGPFTLCRERAVPDPRESGLAQFGCAPSLYEISEYSEPSLFFPQGSQLEFRVIGDRFEVEAIALPEGWDAAKRGFGQGAIFSVPVDRLRELGQLAATGTISIGTKGTAAKGALHAGRYEIYGKSLTGLIPRSRSVLLNEAPIPAGAFVTLTRALSGKDATAHIQLTAMAEDGARALSLLAISETAPVDLKLELFQTDPILLRPSFADAFQNDPLLIVLITLLGALATAIELSKKRED